MPSGKKLIHCVIVHHTCSAVQILHNQMYTAGAFTVTLETSLTPPQATIEPKIISHREINHKSFSFHIPYTFARLTLLNTRHNSEIPSHGREYTSWE